MTKGVMTMSKMIAQERVVYDNYNLYRQYPDDELKAIARECEWIDDDEEITDDMLWSWRYEESETDWEAERENLDAFFQGKTVEFSGMVGVWHGTYGIKPERGEFWQLFDRALRDCDYWKIYDENGHLYLKCSHHDGTHNFEIKVVTDKGYTVLPRFMEKHYGCMAREYEPINKATLIDKLNNQAKSFYC